MLDASFRRRRNSLRHHFAPLFVIVSIASAYSVIFWPYIIDDAFITFAYSKSLSEGIGLVFRPGSNVEATSSFLWAGLLGVASTLASTPPVWSKVFGFIFSLMTIWASYIAFSPVLTKQWDRALIACAAALPLSFGVWANYGMENALLGALCTVAILLLPRAASLRSIIAASLILFLIYTVRPEGFGYVATIIAAEGVRRAYVGTIRPRFLSIPLLLAILVLGYETFGYWAYETLLPDSALAKVASPLHVRLWGGFTYSVVNIWAAMPVFACLAIVTFDIASGKLNRKFVSENGSIALGLALTLSSVLFTMLAGGDWMPAARFYAFITPFSAAYVAWSLLRRNFIVSKPVDLLLISIFAATQLMSLAGNYSYIERLNSGQERALNSMVNELNIFAKPEQTLALSDIGHAAYSFKGTGGALLRESFANVGSNWDGSRARRSKR